MSSSASPQRRTSSDLGWSDFVGREDDLAALASVLGGCRLITLVGPPGIGKSRLARELAAQRGEAVVAWDLREATDLREAMRGLADGLGIEGLTSAKGLPLAIERTLARAGPALLLADDADLVVGDLGAALEVLLRGAPDLRCIVTARRALDVATEHRFEVRPMTTDEGAELFAIRAAIASRRRVDDVTPARVRELVERLDGLPLAIELCAGRSGVLDPAAMLSGLDDRFRLLRGRNADPRHRSLRDALLAAHADLDRAEQRTLAECSVFRGGFCADDAARVTTAGDALLDHLALLAERGWLQPHDGDGSGPRRLRLLESARELVDAEIATPDDSDAARARHAAAFAEQAARAAAAVREDGSGEALAWLARESANVAAARAWLAARDDEAGASVLLAMDARYAQGGRPEAHRALVLVAPELAGLTGPTRVRARIARAEALGFDGRLTEAADDLEAAERDAAALAQDDPTQRELAVEARLARAELALHRLRTDEAEAALAVRDDGAQTPRHEATRLRLLAALAAQRGDHPRAIACSDEAAEVARRVGHPLLEAAALEQRVRVRMDGHELDGAQTAADALAVHLSGLGLPRPTARLLETFGLLALLRGRGDEGAAHFTAALEAFTTLGDWRVETCRTGLAAAHIVAGKPAEACAVIEAASVSAVPIARAERAMVSAVARARLGDVVGARRAIADARAATPPRLAHALDMTEALVDLAEADGARASDPERAAELTASARARGRIEGTPWPDSSWLVARELDRALASDVASATGADEVLVAESGEWFAAGGARVSLAKQPVLARLLAALARVGPSGRLGVAELFAAGWPSQRARHESVSNRVWVAVARLRAKGLAEALRHDTRGYYLTASIVAHARVE